MPSVIKWMVKLTTEILEVREVEEECDSDDSDIPEDEVEVKYLIFLVLKTIFYFIFNRLIELFKKH